MEGLHGKLKSHLTKAGPVNDLLKEIRSLARQTSVDFQMAVFKGQMSLDKGAKFFSRLLLEEYSPAILSQILNEIEIIKKQQIGELPVTCTPLPPNSLSCPCPIFQRLQAPCRHIIRAFRGAVPIEAFDIGWRIGVSRAIIGQHTILLSSELIDASYEKSLMDALLSEIQNRPRGEKLVILNKCLELVRRSKEELFADLDSIENVSTVGRPTNVSI